MVGLKTRRTRNKIGTSSSQQESSTDEDDLREVDVIGRPQGLERGPSVRLGSEGVVYDCSCFYSNRFANSNPSILHLCLFAAICHVLDSCSLTTSSFILKSQVNFLTIVLSYGLLACKPRTLLPQEHEALKQIPVDINTALSWLRISPKLNRFICCAACFAIYPDNQTAPSCCTYLHIHDKTTDSTSAQHDNDRTRTPIRQYATQDLVHWLARLFSQPSIEDALDLTATNSRKPYDPTHVSDIQELRIWKEFLGPDGKQYTSSSSNLVFGMFTDAINPYGSRQLGKHVSITFLIMVCLSLPVELRRLPENVFLVGITPGPKEPTVELFNWILIPIKGRHIFGSLLPFFADLPALRRSLGFASPSATRMCSYCLLPRQDLSNLDSTTWPKRTQKDHTLWATKYHHAQTRTLRDKLLQDHGARYSVLLKLEYWNIIDNHVVDSMHNLLLGLLQWHCRKFWCIAIDDGWCEDCTAVTDEVVFDSFALNFINKMLPRIRIPTWIKRAVPVLGKASFGKLKADEWRNLFTPLPKYTSLLLNFAHLVSLVNVAMRRSTSSKQIGLYCHHIQSYLKSCLVIFEGVKLAPNHHMAIHLADCMEKFGPTRSYWSFPMERMMGQILKVCDNNRLGNDLTVSSSCSEMEITFINKFCEVGNLKSLLEAQQLPSTILPFFEGSLDDQILEALIHKMNRSFPIEDKAWIASHEYSCKEVTDRVNYAPVNSRVIFLKDYSIGNQVYSTSWSSFGRIESIFRHSRLKPHDKVLKDVFFTIKPLSTIPPVTSNAFRKLAAFEMQVSLWIEILTHCAWIEFEPREISKDIEFGTIAVVMLDRS
ncbi:uncharacterized protein VP01_169g6 [Puccinia sorghi]|uniref:Uncharacterized protein n=1 Tax=Puccinia sorghi TaxID=27349 RepID=A0A0L6VGA6_9BASI|nr:uncharacterized protein VP01_169g6 [Puccinia sorghi]